MSEITHLRLPASNEPLRVAARRLRWFRNAFALQLEAIGEETGLRYRLDDRKLGSAFVSWLRKIEAQNPHEQEHRRAFFTFASGMMLYELIRAMPVAAEPLPPGADRSRPEYFWPEGYACTIFCLNVFSAVMAQEFDLSTDAEPALEDIRRWWSFRENAAEQATSVIGFFDIFVGEEPDWTMPLVFRDKLTRRLAKSGSGPALPTGGHA